MFFKIFVLCFTLKLVSFSVSELVRNENYCYALSHPEFKQFATKTAYAMIKGQLAEADYKFEGCDTEKIWLLVRHGATHPSQSTIDKLSKLEDLRTTMLELTTPPALCDEDIKLLTEWKWTENVTSFPEVMSNEGWRELKTLADEYGAAFADFFNSPEKILFRHTAETRVKESFTGFAQALFNLSDLVDVISDDVKVYEGCVKWQDNKDNLNADGSDLREFETSQLFNETMTEISARLGWSEEEQLTVEQIKDIYDMCRFDKAWNNSESELSPWCSAFTEHHIDVLEYHEDMRLYYETGHGADINSRVACKTVVDLLDHFKNTTSHKVVVSFADATTIQLLLTALGTHKDTVRPSTNTTANMDYRKWKSSVISPFASNLAVVKYKCSSEEHQVKFFLNQKPLLDLDWCSAGVCLYDKFTENYSLFEDVDCKDYFCSETSGQTKIVYRVFAIVVNLVFIYLF